MSSTLILPHRIAPSNLNLRPSVKVRYIEHDLYDICRRIQELSPNLFVIELEEGDTAAFAIMEHCRDGVERLVYKVAELDGRVVERLRYLMNVTLLERMEIAAREEHQFEEDRKEEELERLYETLGGPMHTQMVHDGFSLGNKSYPKAGVSTNGRYRR
jgi:hypothetical protein